MISCNLFFIVDHDARSFEVLLKQCEDEAINNKVEIVPCPCKNCMGCTFHPLRTIEKHLHRYGGLTRMKDAEVRLVFLCIIFPNMLQCVLIFQFTNMLHLAYYCIL